jgi:hypothetical protein
MSVLGVCTANRRQLSSAVRRLTVSEQLRHFPEDGRPFSIKQLPNENNSHFSGNHKIYTSGRKRASMYIIKEKEDIPS